MSLPHVSGRPADSPYDSGPTIPPVPDSSTPFKSDQTPGFEGYMRELVAFPYEPSG